MASYTVDWIRPTVDLDNAGQAVTGFQVRITILPWNEARDLFVKEATSKAIAKVAEKAVRDREAVGSLVGVEVKPAKK